MRRLLLAIATVCAANAAQNDYYLHFTADNMGVVVLTAGAPNASPLVPPVGACGMRFQKTAGPESDDLPIGSEWVVENDGGGPDIPDGAFEAYLGLAGCGWNGLTLEPENGGLIAPPGGLAGYLAVYAVYGYWVNSNGEKLAYIHGTCLPDCVGATDLVAGNSWSFVSPRISATKLMMNGKVVPRSPALVFSMGESSLSQLTKSVSNAVAKRRKAFSAGALERSIRASEDDALRRLAGAAAQYRDCRVLHDRGDLTTAVLACDAALVSTGLARAALEAAVEWVRW